MRFNERARLDTSQVRDLRGRGGRVPGGTKTVAGGVGGIIVLLVALLFGGNVLGGDGSDPSSFLTEDTWGTESAEPVACATGADANEQADCRIVAAVNSVQAYWDQAFQQAGLDYRPSTTTFFEDRVSTGCGVATSAVGPFYCPADGGVYLDLGFYDELRSRFGARGGPFAEAYVIAHEYGHHVQHLLGYDRRVGRDRGPQSSSVRLELQADCFAGVWAAKAGTVPGPDGVVLLEQLTEADIRDGLDAASSIGDDRIQEAATGRVDPESFSHGSAEQRQRWFLTGYRAGDPDRCDTWSGSV